VFLAVHTHPRTCARQAAAHIVATTHVSLARPLLDRDRMRRIAVLVALAACAPDDDVPDPPDPVAKVTWYQDVGPVVAEHCMSCHREDGIAPFALETYDDAAVAAAMMLEAVETGLMPPWDAVDAPDCTPSRGWKHDPRLSPAEIDLMRRWIADGLEAGVETPLSAAPETHLANVTHTAVPSVPYVTEGDTDEFICFVLDPQIATDSYMTGWEVRPGNPKVVHHLVLMPVDAATLQAAHDAGVVGTAIDCGLVPTTIVLGAWAPGQGPTETPDGLSFPMPSRSGVVVQIHYHPGGDVNEPDATAIDFELQTTRTEHTYSLIGWGNAHGAPQLQPGPNDPTDGTVKFEIPANVAGHTETMHFTVGGDDPTVRTPLWSTQPHMHYIGTRLEVRVHRNDPLPGEPVDECLVNSTWNFDWQRSYAYDVAIDDLPTVQPGDQIEIRCTYDNTLDNPFVVRWMMEQGLTAPDVVNLGSTTYDEMCIAMFGGITP
jgi:mono/diheme cytochrome c family protein